MGGDGRRKWVHGGGKVAAQQPGSGGGLWRRRRRESCAKIHVIKAREGDGFGGGHSGGGGGGGGGSGWSPSLISLEQPLERENTPFFL